MARCLKCLRCPACQGGAGGGDCWEDRRVFDVRGRLATTAKGLVQLGPGQRVRPGQVVTVSCVPGLAGQSAGSTRQDRALPRARPDDVLPPPLPDLDGWTRPVVIGTDALTVPSADGPLLIGPLPVSPAGAAPSPELLSHVQGALLRRPDLMVGSFEYARADQELPAFPFSRLQRRVIDTFPTTRTRTRPGTEEIEDTGEPLPEVPNGILSPSIYWRLSGPVAATSGQYSGQGTRVDLRTGRRTPVVELAPARGVEVLHALGVRVWLSHWALNGKYGPSGGDGPGAWAIDPPCDLVWLDIEVVDEDTGEHRIVPVPYLHWHLPPDPDGKTHSYWRQYDTTAYNGDSQLFETVWNGRAVRGYTNTMRLDRGAPLAPEEGQPWTIRLTRLLWTGWGVDDLRGAQPYDHSYDADVPGGRVVLHAPADSVSTGSHRDHLQGGATLSLGGAALPCTSWAVLARREGDGPDEAGTPGLVTCDGTRLRGYWAADKPPAEVDVTLLLGLRDARGDPLPAGTVTNALLESELAVPDFPDHVRLLYTLAGQRKAAILAPWNVWRDLDRAGWSKAGKSRPRSLKALAKLPRARWPTPPAHGLAYQGPITPPVLDTAGLPRYGLSPRLQLGLAPFGLRWPWASREALDRPDERPPVKPSTVRAPLDTGWTGAGPAVVVGRASGKAALKRLGGHWAFTRSRGAAGLRPFVLTLPNPPGSLDLTGLRLEHLAAYTLPETSEDS